MREFLTNQASFFKKYICLEFDFKVTPSLIRGKAVHAWLEYYWREKTDEPDEPVDIDTVKHIARKAMEWQIEKERENIDWGKKMTPLKLREEIGQAIDNYYTDLPQYEWLWAEMKDTVNWLDSNWELMPIPLKWVLDLAARLEWEDIIVDHKVVYKFISDAEKWQYDLQAWFFYILYQQITGRTPKKMIFDQIPYSTPEPGKWLLQWDLRALCDENWLWWEKYETNAKLKEKLLQHWLIEPPVYREPYIIDYEESPHVVQVAIETYKRIVNHIWVMALYDVPLWFLPNPFDRLTWPDSWENYKIEVMNDVNRREAVAKRYNQSVLSDDISEYENDDDWDLY